MSFLLILIFVLLGLFVGSFLNVCIDRLPRRQSIIAPPSHCPACNQRLGLLDLIPILSYVWLRGRCRYCRSPIPLRLPLVEGITALLFAFIYTLYGKAGLWLELGAFLIYACLLIIIFFIDMENQLVLDKVTFPGMAIAFVFSFFLPEPFLREPGVRSALLGGATGSGIMALIYFIVFLIFRREGLGFGDVKMAALIGLMVGFPLVIEALLLSWISGGLVAAILLALKVKGRMDKIPSATFMAVAAMVTLLWGQAIYNWYLP
ncbi:MAG: hypothetical protein A2Z28_06240 [Chloroflexi bacterium RBG_16_51_9]|nr:MAG: hypothetical protein A2Z28_06240 [Chloroflexi bacterium RBG_16_51_9]